MISISEKDGATIIVIENPSSSEMRVIEQAKNAQKVSRSDIWAKFSKNKNTFQKPAAKISTPEKSEFPDFEILGEDEELPF